LLPIINDDIAHGMCRRNNERKLIERIKAFFLKVHGYGKLNTHCRTGCSGKTASTSNVALSAIRRAPQLGQNPQRSPKAPTVGATECNQVFGVAAIAAHSQETVFETAASEVVLELPLDILRQCPALCRQMGHEIGVVFFDDLVKKGALRAMARVHRRANTRTGFPASRYPDPAIQLSDPGFYGF
jgi:hypothetical protein